GCVSATESVATGTEAADAASASGIQDSSSPVTPYAAYVSMKEDAQVHILPTEPQQVIGTLKKGQPAIATGKTDNGWLQIYYVGMIGYVQENNIETYTVLGPSEWKSVSIPGEIKINALGDSITYGDKLADTSLSFPNIVSAKAGAAVLNNYGWNGSNVAGEHPDRLIDRYSAMERDANLILVLGGTNDYGGYNEQGTAIGKIGDMTPDTFYGSLNLLMCGLKQMYPDAEIVFMTPLRRVGYMRRNKSGYCLNEYASAIREMAAFWGIRVIDLFNEPELDFSSRQASYLVDGLHPNETGQALIGACVYRRLFTEAS
ncbi:MAG: hypothetical protein J6C33_08125, partial [Lachnospiraceae bacterium]|nr:hypothetical protein [Lachnospiraceae bacterium]